MPRMRAASRSGWNGSSASVFSPVPANAIGRPVTERTERAAPPRAAPSSFVRITAAGTGCWPCFVYQRASFAAVVVLPEPWSPMSMITVGGWGARASRWPLPPRSSTSSSWTTLTTCWAGVSDLRTSWPTAFSRTRSTKARTTLKLTSASRRATRTSRRASWMFSSVRRPRPPRRSKIDCKRVLRESSMEIPTLRNRVRNSKQKGPRNLAQWSYARGVELKAFLAAGLALLTVAPAAAQPGNPNNPADFIRNPHPAMPWAPNNPDRFLSETYGTVIQYIPVPPQQVVIQVPVPLPVGAPPQAQEPPGVPAQSRGEEPSAPAQTQEQTVEIPGYYVAETTTGYWYPERWTLQQQNGVYQWVKLPAEFRKK